jgi:hypothetical protein
LQPPPVGRRDSRCDIPTCCTNIAKVLLSKVFPTLAPLPFPVGIVDILCPCHVRHSVCMCHCQAGGGAKAVSSFYSRKEEEEYSRLVSGDINNCRVDMFTIVITVPSVGPRWMERNIDELKMKQKCKIAIDNCHLSTACLFFVRIMLFMCVAAAAC